MTTTSSPASQGRLSRRWFAGLWARLDAGIDSAMEPAKAATLVDLPPNIVEIGPGLGSNFSRYPSGAAVIAYEPNRHMHQALRDAATTHGIILDIRDTGAEDIDLPVGSADAVVSTLTLCSVDEPTRAIEAIHRVLKPGGRFLFIEHIAAPRGTLTSWAQRVFRRPWALIADRCRLTATTHELIEGAGFSSLEANIVDLGPKLDPSRRTIFGVAVR